ncbi:hypothetical protein C5167_022454 [Papaver somniferum]|uniref:Uncharacterized protein n=1 Tax=Papaver somniferum TaxID=3469 RepID=A0A4Y7JLN5_PAPSO|nr:hypothetical protein C5167_022454 [Papaver somniferum]
MENQKEFDELAKKVDSLMSTKKDLAGEFKDNYNNPSPQLITNIKNLYAELKALQDRLSKVKVDEGLPEPSYGCTPKIDVELELTSTESKSVSDFIHHSSTPATIEEGNCRSTPRIDFIDFVGVGATNSVKDYKVRDLDDDGNTVDGHKDNFMFLHYQEGKPFNSEDNFVVGSQSNRVASNEVNDFNTFNQNNRIENLSKLNVLKKLSSVECLDCCLDSARILFDRCKKFEVRRRYSGLDLARTLFDTRKMFVVILSKQGVSPRVESWLQLSRGTENRLSQGLFEQFLVRKVSFPTQIEEPQKGAYGVSERSHDPIDQIILAEYGVLVVIQQVYSSTSIWSSHLIIMFKLQDGIQGLQVCFYIMILLVVESDGKLLRKSMQATTGPGLLFLKTLEVAGIFVCLKRGYRGGGCSERRMETKEILNQASARKISRLGGLEEKLKEVMLGIFIEAEDAAQLFSITLIGSLTIAMRTIYGEDFIIRLQLKDWLINNRGAPCAGSVHVKKLETISILNYFVRGILSLLKLSTTDGTIVQGIEESANSMQLTNASHEFCEIVIHKFEGKLIMVVLSGESKQRCPISISSNPASVFPVNSSSAIYNILATLNFVTAILQMSVARVNIISDSKLMRGYIQVIVKEDIKQYEGIRDFSIKLGSVEVVLAFLYWLDEQLWLYGLVLFMVLECAYAVSSIATKTYQPVKMKRVGLLTEVLRVSDEFHQELNSIVISSILEEKDDLKDWDLS